MSSVSTNDFKNGMTIDMDGTYPDRGKPGPEDTTTSVNIAGMGPGGIA